MRNARYDVFAFAAADALGGFFAMVQIPSGAPVVPGARDGRGDPRPEGRETDYFFLPAIGFALPLRVRALVWVRWPRTGRPLR